MRVDKLVLFCLTALILLLAGSSGMAQEIRQDSSLRTALLAQPRPYFSFDNGSVIAYDEDLMPKYGARFGVEWGGRYRFGIGFYSIILGPKNPFHLPDSIFFANQRITYSTIFVEPVWIKTNDWLISTPLMFGAGEFGYRQKTDPGQPIFYRKAINLVEADLVGYYKINDWLGIGASGGYRYVFQPANQYINRAASGFIISIRPKLFLAQFANFLVESNRPLVIGPLDTVIDEIDFSKNQWNPGILKP